MTSCYIQDVDPNARVTCGNCGWTGKASETAMIDDIQERIAAGETVPAGQCPDEDCGALVYADDQPKADRYVTALERLWNMLSDAVEGGRLSEADIPDDYRALVEQMVACEAARDAAGREPVEREPATLAIFLEGGLVQAIVSDRAGEFANVRVVVVDYDADGADDDEVTDVPQDDGSTARAVCHVRAVEPAGPMPIAAIAEQLAE